MYTINELLNQDYQTEKEEAFALHILSIEGVVNEAFDEAILEADRLPNFLKIELLAADLEMGRKQADTETMAELCSMIRDFENQYLRIAVQDAIDEAKKNILDALVK
jgi:hypothetical protein